FDRKSGEGAVPHHLGGHTLTQLALAQPIGDQTQVRVGVDVDEPRTYDLSGGIDHTVRVHSLAQALHCHDAPILDSDVHLTRSRAVSVEHGTVSYDQIEHVRLPRLLEV